MVVGVPDTSTLQELKSVESSSKKKPLQWLEILAAQPGALTQQEGHHQARVTVIKQ